MLPLNELRDIVAANKTWACVIIKVINFVFVLFFNMMLIILLTLRIIRCTGITCGFVILANSRAASICTTVNAYL